jgi:hypothetical protein
LIILLFQSSSVSSAGRNEPQAVHRTGQAKQHRAKAEALLHHSLNHAHYRFHLLSFSLLVTCTAMLPIFASCCLFLSWSRALQAKLRIGLAEQSVLVAIAHAATLHADGLGKGKKVRGCTSTLCLFSTTNLEKDP